MTDIFSYRALHTNFIND